MKSISGFYKYFIWLPGMRAFYAAGKKNQLAALGEFSCVIAISLVPLLLIYGIEILKNNFDVSLPLYAKYIDAGQIFFYVSPIVGNIFYLVVIDFKKESGGDPKTYTDERFWFLAYIFLVSSAATLILVLYHTALITNKNALIWSSIIIYGISLYFGFLYTLYGHITNDYVSEDRDAAKAVTKGLAGFNGEAK